MYTFAILFALLFGSSVQAHMEMSSPIPFRSKFGANKDKADFSMTAPLSADQALCKGYAVDFSDPVLGAPSATYKQGESSEVELAGSAVHGGGSCELSISRDEGKTFTVIQAIMGGCPTQGQNLPFTIPADAPVGRAIFSWSWMPKLSGAPEFYQNCAPIEITAGSGPTPKVAYKDRPAMMVANIAAGNGCKTKVSVDPLFPNPGPDVTGTGSPDSTTDCGSSSGPVSAPETAPEAGSGASPSAPAAAPTAPAADSPSPSAPAASGSPSSSPGPISIIPANSTVPKPASPVNSSSPEPSTPSNGTSPAASEGGVSSDGSCGPSNGGRKCPGSNCCSTAGFCGTSPQHCLNAQAAYGAMAGQSRIRRI